MRIKNSKLKLFVIILILFLCPFFFKIKDTLGIYKSTLSTSINLTVLDPSSTMQVTLQLNDGSGTSTDVYKTYNEQMGNDLYTPTRTNYNFMGWYDANNNRIYPSTQITGNVTFHAEWVQIVCKKAVALNTETCSGSSGGCRTGGTGYNAQDTITYGTLYGNESPRSGDAFDCDINYDGTYDEIDQNGKHVERFYFVREKENQNGDDTAVLIHFTSYDSNGRVDSQNTLPNSNIGSNHYDVALGWLPTSSTWDNPGLIDFDGSNGKVTRFLSVDDFETVCGPLSSNGTADTAYLKACFNNPVTGIKNWYMFENSRFQSNTLGRAGIWLEYNGVHYTRLQTSSLAVDTYSSATGGDNMARPVIEIPMSALDGYENEIRYDIDFNSHGGTTVSEIYRRYEGEQLGTLPTPTREHYSLDGWYATYDSGTDTYSNQVTTSTVVHSNMTLHAKWTAKPTCNVTLILNGGSGVGSSAIVDIGDYYDPGTPTKTDSTFLGWYTDAGFNTPYDSTVPISTSTLALYANWTSANYAVRVAGVGDFETLTEAISNVPTGSVKTRVTLLKNITLTDAITIPNNKWVELDGGSYTISGNDISITNNGNLDIIGGTITSTATEVNHIISNTSGAIVNISGGTIIANGSKANSIIANASGATVNISGGTLTNNSTAGTLDHTISANNGTFNITGGVLNTNGQSASINNNAGTLTMSGGEIHANGTAKGQAIYISGGTVNISGTAYLTNVSHNTTNSRATVDNNGGTLNVIGGTIVSSQYVAVEVRKTGTTTRIGTDDGNINISTPVLRGKAFGLNRTDGTVYVYDGIFECLDNTTAVNGTINKPNGINFTDSTVDVSGVTYVSTYLLAPTLNVTFDANGGTVEGESSIVVQVDNGDTIGADMPQDPIRTNYYFDGWYNGNTQISSSTQVTTNFTATARWVQSITNATINSTLSVAKNDSENITITGTDLESVTYSSNDTSVATVDANGSVTGVDVGTATITITGVKSGDTRTVTVTVTPEMHTVTFKDSDNSTVLYTRQVPDGSSVGVNMPGDPTDTNYVFNAWYINGNSLTPFNSSTIVTGGDLIVVASYKEKVTYATVTTSPSPFFLVVGNTGQITITETTQGDTVESYTYSTADSSIATVDANGEVTAEGVGITNIIITGISSNATRNVEVTVTQVPLRTVTFYDSDNTTVLFTRQVDDNSSLGANMPTVSPRQDYVFDGWYINGNSLTPFNSSTTVSGGDINVVAKWLEKISIATIPASPMRVLLGDSVQINVTATGTGGQVEDYTLASSNTNILEVNGKSVFGSTVGTVTLTITGVESNISRTITVDVVNSHSVTFDPDNGNTPSTIFVEIGTSIDDSGEDLPNNPTKSGYTFDDWYLYDETNDVVTTTRLNTSEVVTSNLVYKPRWAGANDVAAIGTTYYTTPAAAIAAVTDSTPTEIRLLKDYAIASGRTTVDSGKNITIDAKGHELSCSSGTTGDLLYVDGGTLRVKNGTFTCNKSTLATLETSSKTDPKSYLYIEDGATVTNTNNRGAVYNSGTLYILGGTIESSTSVRSTITNGAAGARVEMSGGTVSQTATIYTADSKNNGKGAIKVDAGTVIITGGTVTSNSTNSAAIDKTKGGTLIIGTDDNDNSYDATNPIIQGEQYGIEATSNFSIYDGIIKGKTAAVSDESKINGTETGTTKQNGTEGLYYTLYYEEPAPVQKYRINFTTNGGSGIAAYQEYDLNQAITPSDLPTPTRGIYTFDGWFDSNNVAFTTFTPTAAGEMTLYASWSYASSSTPVSHILTSDAMTYYFNNVSSWATADSQIAVNQDSDLSNDDHSTFTSNMYTNFTNYSCSECEWPSGVQEKQNTCNSPSTGTQCDKAKGYDTGVDDDLDVYLYVNGAKDTLVSGSGSGKYITVTNGVIYNMIPGKSYYWELHSDPNVYGVVEVTKNGTHYRRTLNTSIRNLRDLGGMPVSYTVNGNTTNGTIKYGRLFRGAQITSGTTGVNELKKLGITREVDLRQDGDGNGGQSKFETSNYDVSTSDTAFLNCRHYSNPSAYCFANPTTYQTNGFLDVKITNYRINPVANTYFTTSYSDDFDDLKATMKAVMRQIVNHESIFFHCTIGTDRTGTIAYFLEGLLGVSEENRLRDYEMTYYFGLTNRSRFHNTLSSSSINPRFYAMYKSYPTVADIEAFYFTHPESDDATLLAAFRQEMILSNQ